MPAKLESGLKTERLQVLVSESWVARVDAWRRTQDRIPSRSEAIRVLAEKGLDLAEKK